MMLSPIDFELEVRRILSEEGIGLKEFRVAHLEKIVGTDGDYIFDVTARFEALGAEFLVLIECKRQTSPIERATIQILADKMRSVSAHKGMIFSTTRFRQGAVKYAQAHRIALVFIADGQVSYKTKDSAPTMYFPSWIPRIVGLLVTLTSEGNKQHSTLGVIGPQEWKPKSEGFLLKYLSN